ncbi:MAG: glycerol-3-phosphate acyltransferase [Anaerolineae bacterium]|nr:glycerol-3-phosphate acyltransferase [Anaerolineae bacterium]MDW8098425.1 glycerol-3-phosphate acyltransferase [Anaerolineae bacterium]
MISRGGWVLLAFWLGAVPFAVLLGRLSGLGDVRTVGDGNPGATNAWKLGGWRLGLPVLILDFFKGVLPVAVARHAWGWNGNWLVALALAPVLGHAFSPFLLGRGGKGLATTFGVWTGLTLAEGPLVMGCAIVVGLLGLRLRDGWSIALGLLALGADLLLRNWPPVYMLIWALMGGWLLWAYRYDLRLPLRKASDHG